MHCLLPGWQFLYRPQLGAQEAAGKWEGWYTQSAICTWALSLWRQGVQMIASSMLRPTHHCFPSPVPYNPLSFCLSWSSRSLRWSVVCKVSTLASYRHIAWPLWTCRQLGLLIWKNPSMTLSSSSVTCIWDTTDVSFSSLITYAELTSPCVNAGK